MMPRTPALDYITIDENNQKVEDIREKFRIGVI